MGLSPLISGQDPFYMIPSPHVVSFAENNQTVAVAGLLQSEINATNGSIVALIQEISVLTSTSPTLLRLYGLKFHKER